MRLAPLFVSSLLAVGSLALTSGCHTPAAAAQPVEDPGTPAPPEGIARQPYTAAAIRASHPVGTFTTYRILAAGAPPMEQRTDWVESRDEGCVMAARTPPDGPEVSRSSALWWELRDHASFPLDATSVSREVVTVPAGSFECTHYRVQVPASEGGGERHFWFDTQTAGSPVLFTQELGGKEVFRMELVDMNRARSWTP